LFSQLFSHSIQDIFMKKFLSIITYIGALTILFSACRKSVADRTAGLPPLAPSNQDVSAGSWKLILLSRPDSFSVPAPVATSNPLYAADIFEIKGYQANLTGDQRSQIAYWSAGGVLRWNETLRGLMAKYNLPPYQNPDGTYPAPNAANPFAYPQFPFSNPCYAARAYAYVSAAQYDALVACWHYKFQYNRAAPYAFDSTIKALAGKSTLPSYPSEGAVLAGVTAEMMKLLFPTEVASIQQKLEEQELALIMSGSATRSDVSAGESLGRQIAEVFIARGRADNAGKAGGTPTDWANLVSKAQAAGQTPWYSLEVPARPPQLPLFGKVKGFLCDSATIVSLRPGPPPSTSSAEMQSQTAAALHMIQTAGRSEMAIVQKWADGVGTYTPAGHWNAIAADDWIKQNYSEVRWARNYALLNMAEMDAGISCWDIKYFYFNPRPTQMDVEIKTLTGIPNFPAYVSGHSMFSASAATILGHILSSRANDYLTMAHEAANSRIYAGIHYQIDCDAGFTTGQKVGNYAVQRALADGGE
jgi:hypothetical protein